MASHPVPGLAVTALTTVLVAQAAPRGIGLPLAASAMLAAQLSVGWSNDARDAARDIAVGRADKPVALGEISVRAVWTAAAVALATALALAQAISPVTVGLMALMLGAAWAYNLGLKATPWSGLTYLLAFATLPAYVTSTLPGQPAPRLVLCVAAGLVGLGAHFVNVLPDLAGDRLTGVRGLPQLVAARWGSAATRAAALVLLLSASVLLVVASGPGRRWVAVAGLGCSAVLALAGLAGQGRVPFLAAIGIAALDVAVLVLSSETLTTAHLAGAG
jgi:4-hydroxybenzoate polyprenyltransferase